MAEITHNKDGGFYMMPRQLFTDDCPLSLEARVLYTLILDRMDLSLKNDWRDKDHKLYIYYTVEDAAKMLACGTAKAVRIFAELEKLEYISRKRQGLGKPSKIYLNRLKMMSTVRLTNVMERKHQNDIYRSINFEVPDFPI